MEEKARILLVDDDAGVLDITAALLCRKGMAVDAVGSVEAAIARLAENEYHAIVSDMRMPGLGGPGFHAWVGTNRPGLEGSMVFVSGDTTDPETCEFVERCGVICLQKPYTIAALLRAVQAVMTTPAALSS